MESSRAEATGGRTWGGRSAGERREERRERLIEAGVELFGTGGYANTPVKAICEQAGLTERYFYESFSDRHDLLLEIYSMLVGDAAAAVERAMREAPDTIEAQARAGLGAFARTVTGDPRRARIQELEVVGVSDELERRRRAALHGFADLIANTGRGYGADGSATGFDPGVVAMGIVGAVNEQLIDFVLGELDIDLERLIDHQVGLVLAAVQLLGADPAATPAEGPS